MKAIIISLNDEGMENRSDIIRLLSALLSTTETVARRKRILEDEFNIPMTREIEEEVSEMCNLGMAVEAMGIEKGIEKGIIYAPGIDCAFTRHPLLEPSFLYGGFPFKDLRHKFLMAQESDALELINDALTDGFQMIPLPGHFFDMVGFRTPDDVVYLADCLSGPILHG